MKKTKKYFLLFRHKLQKKPFLLITIIVRNFQLKK